MPNASAYVEHEYSAHVFVVQDVGHHRLVTCPECDGRKRVKILLMQKKRLQSVPCPYCHGQGRRWQNTADIEVLDAYVKGYIVRFDQHKIPEVEYVVSARTGKRWRQHIVGAMHVFADKKNARAARQKIIANKKKEE